MNETERIRYEQIDLHLKDLEKILDRQDFKNDFELQQSTYTKICDLLEEQNKIEKFDIKKRTKIKIIRQALNMVDAILELKQKNRARYERLKQKFKIDLENFLKKHKKGIKNGKEKTEN